MSKPRFESIGPDHPAYEALVAATDKAFWCDMEPVEGGWKASCKETGLSVFAHTADGAMRKLNKANSERPKS